MPNRSHIVWTAGCSRRGASSGALFSTVNAARARAQAALDRIRSGEDFAAVAGEVSEDPGSADLGGDLDLEARSINALNQSRSFAHLAEDPTATSTSQQDAASQPI